MNKKTQSLLQQIARENGLQFDSEINAIYGKYRGYNVTIVPTQNNWYYMYYTVSRNGNQLEKKEVSQIAKLSKPIRSCFANGHLVTMTLVLGGKKTMSSNLSDALEAASSFLYQNRYENCCQICGAKEELSSYIKGGAVTTCCDSCFEKTVHDTNVVQQQEMGKKENVIGGIVGAFVGSLIGAIVIVLLGQLGYVAAASGVVTATCTFIGYEKLAGKLSKKGIVISCLIIILAVYLGNRADWAIAVANYFEADFFTAFGAVTNLVKEGYIESEVYFRSLGAVYLFAIIGAAVTVPNIIKNHKMKYVTKKIGERQVMRQ